MSNKITQPTRSGAIDKTSGTPSGFPDFAFEHDGTDGQADPTLTLKDPWNMEVEGTLDVDEVVTIKDTTQSTTKDTGALVIEGGLGVEKNVTLGGTLEISSPGSKYYTPVAAEESLGTLHMVSYPELAHLSDLSITTTWELADFSAYVPSGTKALLVHSDIENQGNSNTQGLLCWAKNTSQLPNIMWDNGSGYLSRNVVRISPILTILAPEGKFYYAEYDAANWAVSSVYFSLIGYYI